MVLRVPPNDKHWQRELRKQKQDTYRIPIHKLSPVLLEEIPGKSSTMFVHGYWGDDMCWILWSHLVLKYSDVQFQKNIRTMRNLIFWDTLKWAHFCEIWHSHSSVVVVDDDAHLLTLFDTPSRCACVLKR